MIRAAGDFESNGSSTTCTLGSRKILRVGVVPFVDQVTEHNRRESGAKGLIRHILPCLLLVFLRKASEGTLADEVFSKKQSLEFRI
ncbi:hypothetical protein SARC_07458 [Sphaeroforma arctica JP610]|uniref:Uncharacterized protein n=1 Tax=Sphaeroforma arctica JP610 TaxID=667725 RepID=A0A0L0FU40_9EUKA|nr:hypothetical protein SARC_07458 [Sphaeroforma arctica JP610]KNC80179.1 hypothetical protein SARC_07458 [Sphaeroforma arctica JP610]|eukprot:XP_014154081.1 hypothetical protein SARC_07458 [Sphaeroforma arctica JP610]